VTIEHLEITATGNAGYLFKGQAFHLQAITVPKLDASVADFDLTGAG
jgi:hypothetical protein